MGSRNYSGLSDSPKHYRHINPIQSKKYLSEMSAPRHRIKRRLDNMSSFKGRYNDTMAAEYPPDPPAEDVAEEEDNTNADKNSLLSPIVNFATGDAVSTTSTKATAATASVMSHSNNSTINSTNNSTTSTISDDDNDYIGDVDEETSNHGANTTGNDGNNNNHRGKNGRTFGKGKSGRRKNPFGAMARRLGKGKSSASEEPRSKEQLAAAVSDALGAFDYDDDNTNNNNFTISDEGEELDPPRVKPLPLAPTKQSASSKNNSPVAEAFQTSVIVLTQVVADIGMAAAEAEAEANGWDVTICISDTVGIPIQVKRNTDMIGTAASFDLAVGKAKMASMFGRPTGRPGAGTQDAASAALVSLYPYLHMSGGVPLILNGTCCGSVGVSSGGLITQDDQEADEQVAWAAVKAMADIYWSYQVLASSGEQ
ncbi:Glcg protein [Seminavis robusta]|uniref:Glcg protein n=1 Tax=Seminavis robusta TaxID=568900 RepID=A0A9N8ERY4_9STRA|nr:Glcg protein [Seminavis robusta]|eukprot:Sro1707_g292640.1 Glcg protein (425) ;mRNA; f:18812-20202